MSDQTPSQRDLATNEGMNRLSSPYMPELLRRAHSSPLIGSVVQLWQDGKFHTFEEALIRLVCLQDEQIQSDLKTLRLFDELNGNLGNYQSPNPRSLGSTQQADQPSSLRVEEWSVCGTALNLGNPEILVQSNKGRYGVVKDCTNKELDDAFDAQRNPYPWKFIERIIVTRECAN